jgi:hypothetical protein
VVDFAKFRSFPSPRRSVTAFPSKTPRNGLASIPAVAQSAAQTLLKIGRICRLRRPY